jgi:hypothetical protein
MKRGLGARLRYVKPGSLGVSPLPVVACLLCRRPFDSIEQYRIHAGSCWGGVKPTAGETHLAPLSASDRPGTHPTHRPVSVVRLPPPGRSAS